MNTIKKLGLIILFLISMFLQSFSQYNKLPDEQLKGRLRKITEINFSVKMKLGRVVKGNAGDTVITFYNRYGKDSISFRQDDIFPITKLFYKYDQDNRLIEVNEYWDDKYVGKVVSKYDSAGNEIEQGSYYGSGIKKYYFKYDSRSNVIEESRNSDKNSDTIKEQTFKYDSLGNQVEETDYYSPDGRVDCIVIKKYNANNKKFEEDFYHVGDTVCYFKDTFKYDESGNIDEWISYETDGRINKWSHKYVYDSTGNWLKQILYNNGKALGVIERMIEYYE